MGPFWLSSPPRFHSRAPISCRSPSSPAATSSTPAFHHIRFPLLPLRSRWNPFPSPPYPVVLLSPLPHQPFTISTSPSSPPRSGQNPFSSPPSLFILPPHPHQPFTISASLSSPSRSRWNPFPSLLSSIVLLPPVSTTSPAPAFHHLHFPSSPPRSGWNPFSSPPSPTVLLPSLVHQPFTIFARHRGRHWDGRLGPGISTEPIALFSSLLSRTILSRFSLVVVDAARKGDREREWKISTEPIALFSSFLSRTNLSPSWPCHRGCRWDEDRERKIRTEGRRAW